MNACERLDAFQHLQHNWDSYGSSPISPTALETAKALLTSLAASFSADVVQQVEVFPRADGGVQLEWSGPYAELEVCVSGARSLGALFISSSGEKRTYEELPDISIDVACALFSRWMHSQVQERQDNEPSHEPMVLCDRCGTQVPMSDAEPIGERVGPDLIVYTLYECADCAWEDWYGDDEDY